MYSIYRQCVAVAGEVGGFVLCCRPYSAWVLHSVSDQIQNLQNCFTTPNKSDQKRRHLGIGVFKVPSYNAPSDIWYMTPLLGILYRNAITSFSFSKDKQLIFTSCTISLVSVPYKNTIRTVNKCHHYLFGYFSFYFPKTKYLQYIRQVPAKSFCYCHWNSAQSVENLANGKKLFSIKFVRLPLQPTTPHWETPSMAVRAILLPVCHHRTAQGLPDWIQTMFGRAVFIQVLA